MLMEPLVATHKAILKGALLKSGIQVSWTQKQRTYIKHTVKKKAGGRCQITLDVFVCLV